MRRQVFEKSLEALLKRVFDLQEHNAVQFSDDLIILNTMSGLRFVQILSGLMEKAFFVLDASLKKEANFYIFYEPVFEDDDDDEAEIKAINFLIVDAYRLRKLLKKQSPAHIYEIHLQDLFESNVHFNYHTIKVK